jgi:hypothetical protein
MIAPHVDAFLPIAVLSFLPKGSLLRRWQLDIRTQPGQPLEDALARRCAAGLDLPDVVLGDAVQLELV